MEIYEKVEGLVKDKDVATEAVNLCLDEVLSVLLEIHKPIVQIGESPNQIRTICERCSDLAGDKMYVPYPCQTMVALNQIGEPRAELLPGRTIEETYYDEETPTKVYWALSRSGLGDAQITDAISQMQNVGILFREIVEKEEEES